jgi:hypothetical protein
MQVVMNCGVRVTVDIEEVKSRAADGEEVEIRVRLVGLSGVVLESKGRIRFLFASGLMPGDEGAVPGMTSVASI